MLDQPSRAGIWSHYLLTKDRMSLSERPGIRTFRGTTRALSHCPLSPIYKRKDSTSQSSASSIATVASAAPLPPARLPGQERALARRGRGLPPSRVQSARGCAKALLMFPPVCVRSPGGNDAKTEIPCWQLQSGSETSNMPLFRIKSVQPRSCQCPKARYNTDLIGTSGEQLV